MPFRTSIAVALLVFGAVTGTDAQDYLYTAPIGTIHYDEITGIGSGDFELTIFEEQSPAFPSPTLGFVIAIQYDPVLVATAADPAPVLLALNGGAGPDFYNAVLSPFNAAGAIVSGFTLGVVYNLFNLETITFDPETPVTLITIETDPSLVPAGPSIGPAIELEFVDGALASAGGGALLNNEVVDETVTGFSPQFNHGSVALVPQTPFIRGDVDGSGDVDGVIDFVYLLEWNLNGGPVPPCLRAADVDGDNIVNALVDGIYLRESALGGGPPPPTPFPGCGIESPTDDTIGCANVTCP